MDAWLSSSSQSHYFGTLLYVLSLDRSLIFRRQEAADGQVLQYVHVLHRCAGNKSMIDLTPEVSALPRDMTRRAGSSLSYL